LFVMMPPGRSLGGVGWTGCLKEAAGKVAAYSGCLDDLRPDRISLSPSLPHVLVIVSLPASLTLYS
jgi:hypothetical protein